MQPSQASSNNLVFLTGATGFLGAYMAEYLLNQGYRIKALRRESSNIQSLPARLQQEIEWVEGSLHDLPWLETALADADYIIHAAAKVSFQPSDKAELYNSNVIATANLVNTCIALQNKGQKISKLVFISSVAALGRNRNSQIIDEETKWEESGLNSWYGKTKYLSELEVWRAHSEGLPVVVVNPSVILGPGDINGSSTTMFRYALKSGKYYTSGTANYVDVRDVAQLAIQLMQSDITGERFVLNAGSISYLQLFSEMAGRFGSKAPSVKAGKFMSGLAWRASRIASLFTGKKPFITRETAQSAQSSYTYSSNKLLATIPFQFRSLEETLDWACKELLVKTASSQK